MCENGLEFLRCHFSHDAMINLIRKGLNYCRLPLSPPCERAHQHACGVQLFLLFFFFSPWKALFVLVPPSPIASASFICFLPHQVPLLLYCLGGWTPTLSSLQLLVMTIITTTHIFPQPPNPPQTDIVFPNAPLGSSLIRKVWCICKKKKLKS